MKSRIRAIPGGTSAGKTIGTCQVLIDLAQRDTIPTITSIVSESLPHLKRGVMRDFLDIMKQHEYYDDERWNKSDFTYTFETGSKIEFFSVDQPSKVRGPRRHRLFMNEANNTPLETFEQLEVRTSEFVILDWNPTNEFWYYTDIKGRSNDVEELTLTYKDNEALPKSIVESIEQRKDRKDWWRVYGLGMLGELEGKIYKDWKIIEEMPHEAKLVGYGLDFGYTNDPTAIIAIHYLNGGYIFDEISFTKGLSNRQIADIILAQKAAPVTADSAEPKSIDELRLYGLTIMSAKKGKGSVSQGIQFVQDQRISVTKSSVNVIKEYRNYLWQVDDNGKPMNVPEHHFSHSMDALRYGMEIRHPLGSDIEEYVQPAYEAPGLESHDEAPSTVEQPMRSGFTPRRRT